MKSLRELRTELLGVRLSATNTSLWSINATVLERGRAAINDALRMQEFYVSEVVSSVQVSAGCIVLPRNVARVINCETINPSTFVRTTITDRHHLVTAQTNMLQTSVTPLINAGSYLEIEYEYRLQELPEDVFLFGDIVPGASAIAISGGVPCDAFVSPGYLEITDDANGWVREVVMYNLALPTGFTGLTRGIQGQDGTWTAGARISACVPCEPEAQSALLTAAEANMYAYWVGHRALYDEFNGNLGGVTTEDLIKIIGMQEARAAERYKRTRKPPKPGVASHG